MIIILISIVALNFVPIHITSGVPISKERNVESVLLQDRTDGTSIDSFGSDLTPEKNNTPAITSIESVDGKPKCFPIPPRRRPPRRRPPAGGIGGGGVSPPGGTPGVPSIPGGSPGVPSIPGGSPGVPSIPGGSPEVPSIPEVPGGVPDVPGVEDAIDNETASETRKKKRKRRKKKIGLD